MSRRANLLRTEIQSIIVHLIQNSLSIDQTYAEIVCVRGVTDVSYPALGSTILSTKGFLYKDVYSRLVGQRTFTVKLFDGSLIQLSYRFRGEELIGHRLTYLPRPLEIGVNEVIQDQVLSSAELPIIRIDYSPEAANLFSHSATHMHIGYSEVCRIPTSAPCTPTQFVLFILRSFYADRLSRELETVLISEDPFESSITEEESKEIHFKVPNGVI